MCVQHNIPKVNEQWTGTSWIFWTCNSAAPEERLRGRRMNNSDRSSSLCDRRQPQPGMMNGGNAHALRACYAIIACLDVLTARLLSELIGVRLLKTTVATTDHRPPASRDVAVLFKLDQIATINYFKQ
jgi:hypothetical protein